MSILKPLLLCFLFNLSLSCGWVQPDKHAATNEFTFGKITDVLADMLPDGQIRISAATNISFINKTR